MLKEGERCWKCGRLLTPENTGPLLYLTDPPKHACTTCDGTGDWRKDLTTEQIEKLKMKKENK